MAVAFDNASGGSFTNSLSHTVIGSTNTYTVAAIIGDLSDTLTGITANGSAMTFITKKQYPSDRWLYLYGITGLTGTFNIVPSGNTYSDLYAVSYTGVSQTGPIDSTNTGATSSTTVSTSTTVVALNCWLVAFAYGGGNITGMTGGASLRGVDSGADSARMADSNGTVPTGAQSISYSFSNSSTHAWMVTSLVPFVAAGTTTHSLGTLGVGS
jgi:hypothetical protein